MLVPRERELVCSHAFAAYSSRERVRSREVETRARANSARARMIPHPSLSHCKFNTREPVPTSLSFPLRQPRPSLIATSLNLSLPNFLLPREREHALAAPFPGFPFSVPPLPPSPFLPPFIPGGFFPRAHTHSHSFPSLPQPSLSLPPFTFPSLLLSVCVCILYVCVLGATGGVSPMYKTGAAGAEGSLR